MTAGHIYCGICRSAYRRHLPRLLALPEFWHQVGIVPEPNSAKPHSMGNRIPPKYFAVAAFHVACSFILLTLRIPSTASFAAVLPLPD